ncbi:hypothetical protein [Mucilaginibacter oryzae]|nr:hypothetical protein [Mucilaginibacter oryzae]
MRDCFDLLSVPAKPESLIEDDPATEVRNDAGKIEQVMANVEENVVKHA